MFNTRKKNVLNKKKRERKGKMVNGKEKKKLRDKKK
jgi:hypothetical protein